MKLVEWLERRALGPEITAGLGYTFLQRVRTSSGTRSGICGIIKEFNPELMSNRELAVLSECYYGTAMQDERSLDSYMMLVSAVRAERTAKLYFWTSIAVAGASLLISAGSFSLTLIALFVSLRHS